MCNTIQAPHCPGAPCPVAMKEYHSFGIADARSNIWLGRVRQGSHKPFFLLRAGPGKRR